MLSKYYIIFRNVLQFLPTLLTHKLLTTWLLTQGYQWPKLVSKNVRHLDLISPYSVAVSDLYLIFFFFFFFFFCHSKAINRLSKPQTLLFSYFPKSLFRLAGMVGEACLPRKSYFPWTPDYTPFNFGFMSVWTFLILSLCALTMFFRNTNWYIDEFFYCCSKYLRLLQDAVLQEVVFSQCYFLLLIPFVSSCLGVHCQICLTRPFWLNHEWLIQGWQVQPTCTNLFVRCNLYKCTLTLSSPFLTKLNAIDLL